MQINNNGITHNTHANNSQKAGESPKAQTSQNAASGADGDSVELSQEALVLKRLETQIIASPDVDTSRVESIRQAIEDGSYTIDADSIAAKILETDERL